MEDFDTGRFLYLAILLGALLFYVVLANLRHIERIVRSLILWALLFIGVLAGYGLWQEWAPRLTPFQITHGTGKIEISKNNKGQFSAIASVNGIDINFLIDTGASNIVLSHSDALKAGINMDNLVFTGSAQTANGTVKTARIKLDKLNLSGVEDTNIEAYVTDGDLFGSLLGMGYLVRYDTIEIKREKLTLTR
jgi:aspartyl protease family protein